MGLCRRGSAARRRDDCRWAATDCAAAPSPLADARRPAAGAGMNQRIWHTAAMIMAGGAPAGGAAASGLGTSKLAPARMAAPSSGSRVAPCRPGVLTLASGPRLSPMTGEHGVFYELVNHGRLACTLAGYPHITLYAGGAPLPFRYVFGGGPYVTGRPPATVTVQPGGAAWI